MMLYYDLPNAISINFNCQIVKKTGYYDLFDIIITKVCSISKQYILV